MAWRAGWQPAFVTAPLILFGAAGVQAGMRFEMETVVEREGRPTETSIEQVLIAGDRARLDHHSLIDGERILIGSMITRDGGENYQVVHEGKAFCGQYPLVTYFQLAGRQLMRIRNLGNADITVADVERVLEEPGPELLGWPTRHLRIQSRLGAKAKLLWFKFDYDLELTDDLWVADGVPISPADQRFLDAYAETGFGPTDEVIAQWLEHLDGLPLKAVSVVKLTDLSDGDVTVKTETTTVTELELLDPADVDDQRFAAGDCRAVGNQELRKEALNMMLDMVR